MPTTATRSLVPEFCIARHPFSRGHSDRHDMPGREVRLYSRRLPLGPSSERETPASFRDESAQQKSSDRNNRRTSARLFHVKQSIFLSGRVRTSVRCESQPRPCRPSLLFRQRSADHGQLTSLQIGLPRPGSGQPFSSIRSNRSHPAPGLWPQASACDPESD